MKQHWSSLDHHVWKTLKAHDLTNKKILVCVSGGADSMALLNVLLKVHKKELLSVFHFHHGPGKNQPFRDMSFSFVQDFALKNEIPFLWKKSKLPLNSETECRQARRQALKDIWKTGQLIATGHHEQDLLETRLIRLLRGTGAQGLPAMKEYQKPWLRPLLQVRPKDLKHYLKSSKLSWLEDPTNQEANTLRNWLRLSCLPSLDQKFPGSQKALARSLENLASLSELTQLQVPAGNKLSRTYYMTCNASEQRELLSRWFYQQGLRDFSRAQIEELQKQLDKRHNKLRLKIGEVRLSVNAQQILLIRS